MIAEETIIKDLTLLAEFMGWERDHHFKDVVYRLGKAIELDSTFKYHSSWDWLMPVVEKVEDIKQMRCQIYVTISPFEISIYCSGHIERELTVFSFKKNGKLFSDTEKKAIVFEGLVKLIKWYNG